jgi:glycosyltransferase involved in cell wall biosynthesis
MSLAWGKVDLKESPKLGPTLVRGEESLQLCVLVPAKDESLGIVKTLESIIAANMLPSDIYVCDDGSKDGTGNIARVYGVNVGNPLGSKNSTRLAPVASAAPQLEKKVDQIAALSLKARIKLKPWSNQIEMMSPKHVALLSPGEKMPIKVTPFSPYLTRMATNPAGEETAVKEAVKR